MDPVSVLFAVMMKNPGLVTSTVQNALKPGTVDVAKMQGSLADLSKGTREDVHRAYGEKLK